MNSSTSRMVLSGLFLMSCAFCELAGAASDRTSPAKITIVFRYDDYSATSDTAVEERIFAAFAKHEVPCLVAVIPCVCEADIESVRTQKLVPLDQRKAAILKRGAESGRLEVALHGYSHQTVLDRGHGGFTEFRGVDPIRQRKRLTEGKALLERTLGQEVTCFVPPWNRYDEKTVAALNELGFRLISEGVEEFCLPGHIQHTQLKHLPATCGLTQLKLAVQGARLLEDHDPIIVVLFHPFDFRENDQVRGRLSLEEFSNLLTWIKSQPDVRVARMKELANSDRDLNVERLRANVLSRYPRLLFPTALMRGRCYVYLTSDEGIVQRRTWLWRATLGMYLPLFVVSGALGIGIGRIMFRRSRRLGWLLVLGGPVILTALVVRSMKDSYISAGEGMRLAFLLGGYLGAVLVFARGTRRSEDTQQAPNGPRTGHSE